MSGVLLTAFTCGWITLPATFFIEDGVGDIRAPAMVFLIDHPQGLVLFDTGFSTRFERRGDAPAKGVVDVVNGQAIADQLRSDGIDPGRIHWIINSHLHFDHAGGNAEFPNATIIVQDKEWDFASVSEDQAYRRKEFDTGQALKKIRGELDLFGDKAVVVFPSPGHTPGHQCVRVVTSTGVAILAADCCNLRRSLDELKLPDHCFNREQYLATLKLLRAREAIGEKVFPGHDPEFWERVPQRRPLYFAR